MSHLFFFFFFNDTATTEIYTLSLHDALPILGFKSVSKSLSPCGSRGEGDGRKLQSRAMTDRKSTRLNSSHSQISYAVFCLKKKKQSNNNNNSPANKQQPVQQPTLSHYCIHS